MSDVEKERAKSIEIEAAFRAGVSSLFAGLHARDRALVVDLCERIGYGFVMQAAAEAWRAKDPAGAIVTGPCAAFTKPCDCNGKGCDTCHGCGWRFK